jgi:hypothetical protein
MNDECADKIADNRFSIDNSRDWLVNDGGVIDRVHRMSAKTVSMSHLMTSDKSKRPYYKKIILLICFS